MNGEPFDAAACVDRVRGGDEDAAQRLVEHCHPLVMRLVRAHRPRTIAAEDLAQEVYLKVFTRLNLYEVREGVPFEHWLSRLAVRTCLDALRSEARQPLGRPADLGAEARAWLESLETGRVPPPDEALGAREMAAALLERLPPADRLVLTLLDLEDRPPKEVAALLGWNATLVRVRAFRARRRLRSAAREMALPASQGRA